MKFWAKAAEDADANSAAQQRLPIAFMVFPLVTFQNHLEANKNRMISEQC
ncbi:MAG: hypothetical protein KGZ65_08305 [Sphingomonadales bacterium]|nr:hypothetical protein [Sphingomonadaceae bacterium]MBS3931222.1 hypothetical protein [Sphingomonadales bacterium]